MSQNLVTNSTVKGELTKDDVGILKRAGIVPNETPLDQILVFAKICAERNLSPFSREIYLVGYSDWRTKEVKYTPIVGIDGYRKKAAMTNELAGCSEPIYNVSSDGTFKSAFDLKNEGKLPTSCRVTVKRLKQGHLLEFTAECIFMEFAATMKDRNTGKQVLSGKWKTMPFQMIAKCAEAFALRKGFNDQLAGLHIAEEIGAFEQGDNVEDLIEKEEVQEQIKTQLQQINNFPDLQKYFKQNPQWGNDASIIQLFSDRKLEITNEFTNG